MLIACVVSERLNRYELLLHLDRATIDFSRKSHHKCGWEEQGTPRFVRAGDSRHLKRASTEVTISREARVLP